MIAKLRTIFIGISLGFVVAGCGTSVTLDPPTIPPPNINRIPVTVAVRLPENFKDFVHQENVLGREEWTIDLGSSNSVLFTQLLGYMFDEVIMLQPGEDPTGMTYDALIEPSIDAFEFSVPNQTKTDAFAVWIRYRIKVYDRYGTMVANQPISAYGKSLTTTMGGSGALQRAAILAMRDAAALMIMKFDGQTLFTALADPSIQMPAVVDEEASKQSEAQATILGGSSNE
ncbi:MAG: hypothetical protein O7G83_19685 [Proteobacteria bacterium]|nr:hypothetical protein [Pseudomonadota bacterium]